MKKKVSANWAMYTPEERSIEMSRRVQMRHDAMSKTKKKELGKFLQDARLKKKKYGRKD